MSKRYTHEFAFSYHVDSDKADASDVTPEQHREACEWAAVETYGRGGFENVTPNVTPNDTTENEVGEEEDDVS